MMVLVPKVGSCEDESLYRLIKGISAPLLEVVSSVHFAEKMFHRHLNITEVLVFSVFGAESLLSNTFNPAAFEQDAAPLDMGPHKLCCWRLAKC
jgi:uncharacterized membrane protein YwaF